MNFKDSQNQSFQQRFEDERINCGAHGQLVGVGDLRILEQPPRLLVRPIFRHGELLLVNLFQNPLDALVLLDQLDGPFRADAADGAAVVATEEDAEINELEENKQRREFNRIVEER